jgi:DNA-binding CsgD family transcriptional regulator
MSDTKEAKLTKTELKVLCLLAKGHTSKAIGDELNITESTAQTHRRNMLRKLGASNTQQMISWGYRNGLLR